MSDVVEGEGSKGLEGERVSWSEAEASLGENAVESEEVGSSWYAVVVASGCFLSLVLSAISMLEVKGSSSESWAELDVEGICCCA